MKLFTKTFGCQMNFADSDEMSRHLFRNGFASVERLEEASAVLVNTCTIRDMAEHKASSYLGTLEEWKAARPGGLIILTGCAAERAKDVFRRRFPHVDLIVGAKDIDKFPQELDAFLRRSGHPGAHRDPPRSLTGSPMAVEEADLVPADDAVTPVSAFVTIMRGCNYSCTYCIVPAVRGRESYRPAEDILREAEARVREGAREIWLLGQTVNSYRPAQGPRPGYDFADLLRDVDQIPDLKRVRFMSPHPFYLTPKLIDAMADCGTVCEHIHLPAQSGSTAVLARMKRTYTRESYLAGLSRLRERLPGIAVSTDLIVGFPGETEEDFQATLSLVEEADFDSAYCFKYSSRPGTASADMEDDVSAETKERRVNELLALVDSQGAQKVKRLIGTTQEVLVEDEKGEGVVRGKTRTAWRVRLTDPALRPGDIVKARITATHSRELHGEWIP